MPSKIRITLAVDPELDKMATREAKRRKMSKAALVREALAIHLYQGGLESRDEIHRLKEGIEDLIRQLFPLGSNLNQMVLTWHELREIDSERMKENFLAVRKVLNHAVEKVEDWRHALRSIR